MIVPHKPQKPQKPHKTKRFMNDFGKVLLFEISGAKRYTLRLYFLSLKGRK